jgi:multicomponent Na+:H+ antiporter subunit C
MLESYNYWMTILLMMIGLFGVISRGNLVKKMMGLAIFQVSVLLLYISAGNITGGAVPVIKEGVSLYVNPIPQVLMLTAIVVGVAVMAVGLALIVRIKEEYGTIEEDEIIALDMELNNQENNS